MQKQINIREELNKRDAESCTTDFVNMYEALNLSLDKKKRLAELLAKNVTNKTINRFLEKASEPEKKLFDEQYFEYKGLVFSLWYLDGEDEFGIVCDDILEDYDNTPVIVGYVDKDATEQEVRKIIRDNYDRIISNVGKNYHYYDSFEKNLKEEYGYYKDEPYCEEIADSLENGTWTGETSNGTSWELTINGHNSDEFSPSFANYLAEEVAYPVRDGHLAYLGIEMILYKSSMESIFGYDELDKLIPDLIKLDVDRESIDEWLASSDPDEILDFHYDFNIAFDEAEWEENNREDVDLPTEVTYDFYSLVDDDVDINSDDYNLDDVIADRLSDDYGYTHYGFEYDVDTESGDVYVYNIEWDISESLNKSNKSLKESKNYLDNNLPPKPNYLGDE